MKSNSNIKQCLWCLKTNSETTFEKKAHTIPKSLGGQNYNQNVCDECNYYFGNRECHNGKYSIEVALKEAFNISRKMFLTTGLAKRKVGDFKSQFFEVKERKGKYRLIIKDSFRFTKGFQEELCRAFKRGLLKMYLEELNRQTGAGFESKFDSIREFARHNKNDIPVFYFYRKLGMIMIFKSEAETPTLYFGRMKYLVSNDKFCEIEFLGHVFGFPIAGVSMSDFENHVIESVLAKKEYFSNAGVISKLTDIDLTLKVFDN
jgi:hypothetical protein